MCVYAHVWCIFTVDNDNLKYEIKLLCQLNTHNSIESKVENTSYPNNLNPMDKKILEHE